MDVHAEQELRTATAAMVLERLTNFKGESKEQFAASITAAHIIADESRHNLQRWIDAGRRAGMSWLDVGAALGITRQAAQQRFGSVDEQVSEFANEIVITGATAFNEVRLLEEEGAKGHELIQTGMLKLVFRPTDQRWEHARVLAVNPQQGAAQLGEGWQYVSSWFPFHYFKKRAQSQGAAALAS